MVPKLIGLSGKLRSGKDTVADKLERILSTEYTLNFSRKAFGDRLKRTVQGLTGCEFEDLQSQTFKASLSPIHQPTGGFYTYRQLLQRLADMLRAVSPNVLIDALFANLQPDGLYIISDVRKENEVRAIKERGGLLIRVERPDLASPDQHNTETELDGYGGFDYVIVNDGTLDELDQKVRALLADLMKDTRPDITPNTASTR